MAFRTSHNMRAYYSASLSDFLRQSTNEILGIIHTNDASAETMQFFREMMDSNDIIWQIGELGKVDQGGGGTVAGFMARRNIETVDVGVPVLSMHAPFDVISKFDLYMFYKACAAFYQASAED